jgi:hypothetical protein
MCDEVARHTRAGSLDVEAPRASAALRHIGTDGPVLKERGAIMEDAAKLAGIDHVFDEGHGGDAAVIVPDHVGDAGLLDRVDHRLGFLGGAGQRLFRQHHLAGLGGSDGDFGVQIVGHADVDGVDVRRFDQLPPVALDAFIPPGIGKGAHVRRVAPRHRLQHRLVAGIEEVRDLAPGV